LRLPGDPRHSRSRAEAEVPQSFITPCVASQADIRSRMTYEVGGADGACASTEGAGAGPAARPQGRRGIRRPGWQGRSGFGGDLARRIERLPTQPIASGSRQLLAALHAKGPFV